MSEGAFSYYAKFQILGRGEKKTQRLRVTKLQFLKSELRNCLPFFFFPLPPCGIARTTVLQPFSFCKIIPGRRHVGW